MPDVFNQFLAPQWGIFDQFGNAIIVADSVVAFEFTNSFRISDYPQEKGAFETYNKVKIPYEARIVFAISGGVAKKQTFIANLELALHSLDTYVVWTPEYQYANANIVDYHERRDAGHGAQLILIEVALEEVRILGSSVLTNTQSVNGNSSVNNGFVQPQQIEAASNYPVNVTPDFWSSVLGFPILPTSAWDSLTTSQQTTITTQGIQNDASSALVSPVDDTGSTQVFFGYP